MVWWRKPTKEQLARRERWQREHVPRIEAAQRPNAAYITEPHVVAVLQHLADGVNEVLMARPLAPFPWLADYLRHACKVAYCIEQDAATVLMGEIHKKRRVIQNALLDTKADEVESKRLIREIITQQITLCLPDEQLVLADDDHLFLTTEVPRHQSMWSIDENAIPLPLPETAQAVIDLWMETHLVPRRHIEEYASMVMNGITHALVEMELVSPENCAEWIVLQFRQYGQHFNDHGLTAVDPSLTLFFKTNYELMRKIDSIKRDQRDMHLRRSTLEEIHAQLCRDVACRQRFIDTLRVSHTTTRTHAIMAGTPCFLNSQKVWVLPGHLLLPEQLSSHELLGLQRAERFLMEEDETRWKFLLLSQKRYDAATALQAAWRCAHDYRVYETIKAKRREAATVLQRNYLHHLYQRAIRLPKWCVLGREVVVARSIALKLAITFQFYPKKDFPTGNFKRLDRQTSTQELMEICRQDDGCAAFATDRSLKRFVPRKLSQLKAMQEADNQPLTMQDGIYIKVFPAKDAPIVTTGIITDVPKDRFGLVTVVLDGTGDVEQVPLPKLTDRWKKIRVRRRNADKKKRRAFVFGGNKLVNAERDDEATTMRSSVHDYDVLEEDEDQVERRERREQRRARLQSNEREAQGEELLDFVYEDQATKQVRDREPHCTYKDADERTQVIAKRQRDYALAKAREYEAKKLQSVIRLQCAWRSKRAREAFRQVLQLRAKEKERDQVVQAVHITNQRKHDERRAKQKDKSGFFGRWMRW